MIEADQIFVFAGAQRFQAGFAASTLTLFRQEEQVAGHSTDARVIYSAMLFTLVVKDLFIQRMTSVPNTEC